MVSPFGLGRAVTSANQFIGALTIVNVFYGLVFLFAGIAVLFVKEEKEGA
jgi:hypothetical protein